MTDNLMCKMIYNNGESKFLKVNVVPFFDTENYHIEFNRKTNTLYNTSYRYKCELLIYDKVLHNLLYTIYCNELDMLILIDNLYYASANSSDVCCFFYNSQTNINIIQGIRLECTNTSIDYDMHYILHILERNIVSDTIRESAKIEFTSFPSINSFIDLLTEIFLSDISVTSYPQLFDQYLSDELNNVIQMDE